MSSRNIIIDVAVACTALWSCCSGNGQDNDIQLNRWMSLVNDTMRVCRMSIPGTHDALTAEDFSDPAYINDYTTQVASFDEQLNGGIRYFDIRLLLLQGKSGEYVLQTCHRTATLRLTFDDVLAKAEKFLTDNPSEFLIFKIQYDGGTMNDIVKSHWITAVQRTLKDKRNSAFFAPFRPDIRISNMRGKILLVSRTDYGKPLVGAMTSWIDEGADNYLSPDTAKERNLVLSPSVSALQPFCGGDSPQTAKFYVQDFYNSIGLIRTNAKLHAVRLMFKASQQLPPNSNVWILNHTSGFSVPKMNAIGYAENASKTNPLLLSLIKKKKPNRNIGIIAMDFACTDTVNQKIGTLGVVNRIVMSKSLTSAIIELNLR